MPLFDNKNQGQNANEQLKMIQAISCVVDPSSALYISGPITTGKSFIDWYLLHGYSLKSHELAYQSRLRADVIKLNEENILALAAKTREQTKSQVIEPASLFVSEWTQVEYIQFWMKIIDRFVKEIVLVDGWQYSIGCVTEYNYAEEKGILIRTHDGSALSSQQGKNLIMTAADEVAELAENHDVLEVLATGLRKAATEK